MSRSKFSIDLAPLFGHFADKAADKKRFNFLEEQARLDRDFQNEQNRRALDDKILFAREESLLAAQREQEAHELKLKSQREQNEFEDKMKRQDSVFKFMAENNLPPTMYEEVDTILLEQRMKELEAKSGADIAASEAAKSGSELVGHRSRVERETLEQHPEVLQEAILSDEQKRMLLPYIQAGQGLLKLGGQGNVTGVAEMAPFPGENRMDVINQMQGRPIPDRASGLTVLQPEGGGLNIGGLNIPRRAAEVGGGSAPPALPSANFGGGGGTPPPSPMQQPRPAQGTQAFPIPEGMSPSQWHTPGSRQDKTLGELLQEELFQQLRGRRW